MENLQVQLEEAQSAYVTAGVGIEILYCNGGWGNVLSQHMSSLGGNNGTACTTALAFTEGRRDLGPACQLHLSLAVLQKKANGQTKARHSTTVLQPLVPHSKVACSISSLSSLKCPQAIEHSRQDGFHSLCLIRRFAVLSSSIAT